MRIVVLDSFAADQGEDASFWSDLGALGELTLWPRTAPADVVARSAGAAAILTNKVVIGADVLAALPDLRYIGVTATGTNVVDVAAARAAGIAVTNVPSYASESVAELVFALILHFTHDVAGHDAAVKAGRWAQSPDFAFFTRPLLELAGKTLVTVGTGAIGAAVSRIAAAFGMRVIAAAGPGAPARTGAERMPLAEALPIADFISLHCPLTDSTRGLVDARFLSALKPGAILINTGRGALVDEPALVDALTRGHLGGAALDVLSVEPPAPDHPLTNPSAAYASRLVVTPHIGWGTIEARRRLAAESTTNLAAFVSGKRRNRID
jgi:glycerate dehydrogenase